MLNKTLLKTFKHVLQQLETKWWLDFGQLLSAKRVGKILEWDRDIDFCIIANSDEEWTYQKNIIVSELEKSGLILEIWRNNNRMIQGKLNNFNFDFYRAVEDGKWISFPVFKEGMRMRTFFYDEIETIKINDVEFNSPRHLDLYLQIRYGDDWRLPIKNDWSKIETNPRQDLQYNIKVITCGVFDLFHEGHQKLIQRCKNLFDDITVGLHSDETVASYKRVPIWSQNKRKEEIIKSGLCENIICNFPLKMNEILLNDYNFVVYGREDNNLFFYEESQKNHPIKRTGGISTTQLIK